MEDGKRLFRMPDGREFASLVDALRHMVTTAYDRGQVAALRPHLKSEGWEWDSLIPMGCQIKYVSETQSSFLGRDGEYFDNISEAVKFMSSSDKYREGDLKLLKSKVENLTSKKRKSGAGQIQPPAKKQQTKSLPASNPQKRKSDSDILTAKRARSYVGV